MQAAGFRHTLAGDINQLRDVLREYKSGFPILKELIANAEDAGATTIDFAILDGHPTAPHPLLRGPALVVANDGAFTRQDAIAIRAINASGRTGVTTAIGRFGLGLKSIFHFCEAFFYGGTDRDGNTEHAIFNPWSTGEELGPHADWDATPPQVFEWIAQQRRRISLVTEDAPTSRPEFWIWAPLRQKLHVGASVALENVYYGDDLNLRAAILSPDRQADVASILPLLTSLRCIRFWEQDARGTYRAISYALAPWSQRRQWTADSGMQTSSPFSGAILRNHLDAEFRFGGYEIAQDSKLLQGLKSSPLWPKRGKLIGNRYVDTPEPGEPHGAVCFVQAPEIRGLRIQWAVFLPVGQPIDIPASTNVRLTLHGYFFVNPSRTTIEFPSTEGTSLSDDAHLRVMWNQALRDQLVLPHVLPALDRFVTTARLNVGQTSELTRALSSDKSPLHHSSMQRAMCQTGQWVLRLRSDGPRWELIAPEQDIYELPLRNPADSAGDSIDKIRRSVDETFRLAIATFPAFPRLAEQLAFVPEKLPRIATRRPERLPDEALEALLTLPAASLADRATVAYLGEVLERHSIEQAPAARRSLFTSLRKLLAAEGLQRIRTLDHQTQRSLFAPILSPLADRLLSFSTRLKGNQLDTIVREFARQEFSVLALPQTFVSKECKPTLDIKEADRILRWLSAPSSILADPVYAEDRQNLALRILECVDQTIRHGLLERCADLRVFSGNDLLTGASALSFRDIDSAKSNGLLFSTERERAHLLVKALDHRSVLLISDQLYQTIYGERAPRCDAQACSAAVLKHPLADPEHRAPLLENLLKDDIDPQALRALLHGSRPGVEATSATLLLPSQSRLAPVWEKLMRTALTLGQGSWRLVNHRLAELIPERRYNDLNARPVTKELVMAEITRLGPERFDCRDLDEDDVNTLLRDADLSLLRCLPIHRDRFHIRRAIVPGRTFLPGSFSPDDPLSNEVILLAESPDENIRRRQLDLVPRWNAKEAIEFALTLNEPHRYWRSILGALESLAQPDQLDILRLRETPWLVTTKGEPWKPADVIHVPGLELELAKITARSDGTFLDVQRLDPALRDHPGFDRVAELILPPPRDVLSLVGSELARDPDYCLGIDDPARLMRLAEAFIRCFESVPPEVLPCAQLVVATLKSTTLPPDAKCALLTELCRPLPSERLIAVFDHLANFRGSSPPNKQVIEICSLYLRAALAHADRPAILKRIRLPNQAGDWKLATELCLPSESNVHETAKLHSTLEDAFAAAPPFSSGPVDAAPTSRPNPQRSTGTVASILEEYFRPWENQCPDGAIGAFLSLLGSDPRIRPLAATYLRRTQDSPSPDDVVSRLKWQPVVRVPNSGTWIVESQAPHDRPIFAKREMIDHLKTYRFSIGIQDPSTTHTVQVRNLLGELFSAPSQSEPATLMVGSPITHVDGTIQFDLRLIDVHSERANLSNLLLQTAREICAKVYQQVPENLDEAWEKVEISGQSSVRFAREWILEDLRTYLQVLAPSAYEPLSNLRMQYDKARKTLIEARDHYSGESSSSIQRAQREIEQAKYALAELVAKDRDAQTALLEAVRRKIRDYQYRPDSVLFELFQNADDALVQLIDIDPNRVPRSHNSIDVRIDDHSLEFLHFGRPINQSKIGDFDGEMRGYHLDLVNMLRISASDKVAADDRPKVTGKFGLGFKSVFLICDRPRILSGGVACDIVAGILPENLPGEAVREARKWIEEEYGVTSLDVTWFRLDLRSGLDCAPAQFVRPYLDLLPYLLVFAKAIRECRVHAWDGPEKIYTWRERNVIAGVGVGSLPIDEYFDQRGLVLRGDEMSLLVGLGPRGAKSLPNAVPTF
ncbi:MAG: hypothetical protein KatS3mg060_2569 [Dehalococcoidia bacterium]|nr:MAG: hypothetical protein KatS3mg060_2569 [Dehalococcoidia bacterium]